MSTPSQPHLGLEPTAMVLDYIPVVNDSWLPPSDRILSLGAAAGSSTPRLGTLGVEYVGRAPDLFSAASAWSLLT